MANQTPLDRRGFFKIAGRYGLTSTVLAATSLAGPLSVSGLARAASQTADARKAGTPLMTLKFGASGFNEENLKIQESGQLWFAQELEKRSDGALNATQTNEIIRLAKEAQEKVLPLIEGKTAKETRRIIAAAQEGGW